VARASPHNNDYYCNPSVPLKDCSGNAQIGVFIADNFVGI